MENETFWSKLNVDYFFFKLESIQEPLSSAIFKATTTVTKKFQSYLCD